MGKKIVVCLDGTWNRADQVATDPSGQGRARRPSNVFQTWAAVVGADQYFGHTIDPIHRRTGLVAIYLQGVGSRGPRGYQIGSGATGLGISSLIREAYFHIAQSWVEGDEIFLFGFSRGAFAARSTAGMLHHMGIPARSLTRQAVRELYTQYKLRTWFSFRRRRIPVRYLGIWDTVSALALPDWATSFHDISPSNVQVVRHALALDEVRSQFAPNFWGRKSRSQDIREVWFAGAHSNVGGGYYDTNLSNIAMFWIMREATLNGLTIDLERVPGFDAESAGHCIRPSWHEFWDGIHLLGKAIIQQQGFTAVRCVPRDHYIHESVYDAVNNPMFNPPYKPLAKLNLKRLSKEGWGFGMV